MFSLFKISLLSIKVGPTINAVGSLGFARYDSFNPHSVKTLFVPWRTKTPGNDTSSLLQWQARVSRFTGRENEIAELKRWAEDTTKEICIRFVIADGGCGKSRLGAEFAERMQQEGWAAGFVNLRKGSSFLMESKGTLLIIDYPEEHVEQVRELLIDLAEIGEGHRIRVLFLTRRERSEWEELIQATGAHSLIEPDDLYLTPLDATSARLIFNDTATKADEAFNPDGQVSADHLLASQAAMSRWIQSDEINQRPLFVMAAAVNSAQYPDKPELQYSGKEAVTAIAQRELDRYIRLGRKGEIEMHPYLFARAKAITALTGPLTIEQLRQLEKDSGVPLGFADNEAQYRLRHSGLFDKNGSVPIMQPDILAASFLVVVLSRRPEYAPELLWAAVNVGGQNLKPAIDRLIRLCYDAERVLGILDFKLGVQLGIAVGSEESRSATLEQYIRYSFPMNSCSEAFASAVEKLLKHTTEDERRGRLLGNLAYYLSAAEKPELAFEAIRSSVVIFESLNKANPHSFRSHLAQSIARMTEILSQLGRYKDALNAAKKGLFHTQILATEGPLNRPDFRHAHSLFLMSVCLLKTGDHTSAFKFAMQSASVFRRCIPINPRIFFPRFVNSLRNLFDCLMAAPKEIDRTSMIEVADAFQFACIYIEPIAMQFPDSEHAQIYEELRRRLADLMRNLEN